MGPNVRKLVLVRHSQPQIERDVPAAKWRLSALGRRRAESMAASLRDCRANVIWCSREPKAVETAEIVGSALNVSLRVKDGLEEHQRCNVPFFPTTQEFEQAVQAFFAQPCRLVLGTETARQAADRFAAAIDVSLRVKWAKSTSDAMCPSFPPRKSLSKPFKRSSTDLAGARSRFRGRRCGHARHGDGALRGACRGYSAHELLARAEDAVLRGGGAPQDAGRPNRRFRRA